MNELTTMEPMPVIKNLEHGELEVTAESPAEMKACHASLISWCEGKIKTVQGEADELEAAYQQAKKNAWKSSTLQKHAGLARRRVEYYSKMLVAFQAGYFLVPNFPLTVFAVRTDREYPKRIVRFDNWQNNFRQEVETLPAGEGDYQNPDPKVKTDPNNKEWNEKTGQMVAKQSYWADRFQEIEFPLNMAKPHIMEATSHAMGLKVFDQIGILPDPRPKKDPVICGQIIDPRDPYKTRRVTFIIGWHLDTRTL